MNIGFDITVLSIAKAGIFIYRYNLLRALLQIDRENEYQLLDYTPLHSRYPLPPQVTRLAAKNARLLQLDGLRHHQLARWELLQLPPLRSMAAAIDGTLLWPWKAAAETTMRRKLIQALAGISVFHSSDVLLWRQPDALNVVTIYDLTALLFPETHTANTRELQRRTYRFAKEQADVVIAISEATKQDIVVHLGISEDRIRVVYGGIDAAFHPIHEQSILDRILTPMALTPGGYILYVGTIEPRKNLKRLLEAYRQAKDHALRPVPRLALAGAKGWQFQDVFKQAERLGLEETVTFLGEVPGHVLPALYNGASIFVYPSLYEGFGLPPLEAMACGTPVVVSNTSSLPEIVGDAAILINPKDTQQIADALTTLLNDAEHRADLSRRGLARARLFSWKRAARDTLEIYHMRRNENGE